MLIAELAKRHAAGHAALYETLEVAAVLRGARSDAHNYLGRASPSRPR